MTPEMRSESRNSWQETQKKLRENDAKLFRSVGALSIEDVWAQIDNNMNAAKKCLKCGTCCKTFDHLHTHINSRACKRKVAEQKGEIYCDPGDVMKYCVICKGTVKTSSWERHLRTQKHNENLRRNGNVFKCIVCDTKDFTGPRAKRNLKRHCGGKKHMKMIEGPENKKKHDEMIKIYF